MDGFGVPTGFGGRRGCAGGRAPAAVVGRPCRREHASPAGRAGRLRAWRSARTFGFGLAPSTFTFVGYEHFYDRRPFEHRLPAREASTVFKQTTVNNDFVVAANGRLINRGVDPQRIADAARMPIRPVAVRDLEASRHAFRTPSGSWMTMSTRPANARADPMAARGNAPGGSRKNETVLSKWPALPNAAPPSPVGQQPVRPVSPTYSVPRYEPVAPRGGGAVPAHSEAH